MVCGEYEVRQDRSRESEKAPQLLGAFIAVCTEQAYRLACVRDERAARPRGAESDLFFVVAKARPTPVKARSGTEREMERCELWWAVLGALFLVKKMESRVS
jgi:hypothetical protein